MGDMTVSAKPFVPPRHITIDPCPACGDQVDNVRCKNPFENPMRWAAVPCGHLVVPSVDNNLHITMEVRRPE